MGVRKLSIGSSKREPPNAAIVSRQVFAKKKDKIQNNAPRMETQICTRRTQDVQGSATYV